jgi:hypothetical protein
MDASGEACDRHQHHPNQSLAETTIIARLYSLERFDESISASGKIATRSI